MDQVTQLINSYINEDTKYSKTAQGIIKQRVHAIKVCDARSKAFANCEKNGIDGMIDINRQQYQEYVKQVQEYHKNLRGTTTIQVFKLPLTLHRQD